MKNQNFFSQAASVAARQALKNLRNYYDDLAEQWSRDTEFFRDDLISRHLIVQLAQEISSEGVVLDCGCGDGNLARLLSLFAKEVVGVDTSPRMLAEARKRSEGLSNVRYVEGDMLRLRETAGLEPESFDLCVAVYAVCCLESKEQLTEAFRQMYEALKPGGSAIIQIPQPLEGYFKDASKWAMDENSPENYFTGGQLVYRQLKIANGGFLRVARYHFPLSDYLNAVLSAGLVLKEVFEPRPAEELVARYTSLRRESLLPSSLILLAER